MIHSTGRLQLGPPSAINDRANGHVGAPLSPPRYTLHRSALRARSQVWCYNSGVWAHAMEQPDQEGLAGGEGAAHKMSQEGQLVEAPDGAAGAAPAAADFHEALKRVVKSCVVLKCVLVLQHV